MGAKFSCVKKPKIYCNGCCEKIFTEDSYPHSSIHSYYRIQVYTNCHDGRSIEYGRKLCDCTHLRFCFKCKSRYLNLDFYEVTTYASDAVMEAYERQYTLEIENRNRESKSKKSTNYTSDYIQGYNENGGIVSNENNFYR
jgi:hypothetical protein